MPSDRLPEVFTIREAANQLGVHRITLRRWIAERRLGMTRLSDGTSGISQRELFRLFTRSDAESAAEESGLATRAAEWRGPMPPIQYPARRARGTGTRRLPMLTIESADVRDDPWFALEPRWARVLLAGMCPRTCRGECRLRVRD